MIRIMAIIANWWGLIMGYVMLSSQ